MLARHVSSGHVYIIIVAEAARSFRQELSDISSPFQFPHISAHRGRKMHRRFIRGRQPFRDGVKPATHWHF